MLRPRLICLLAALIALAGVVTACGSDDASVDEVLAETFGEDKQIRSGRLDLTVRADVQGLPTLRGPITVRLSGPFAATGKAELPRFDLNLGLSGNGQSIEAGAVSTGDEGFLRFAGTSYALGAGLMRQVREGYAEQARCSAGREGGVSLASLGVDPRRWLREAQDAGSEEVGGVETTHVRARVDVPRLLEDVNRVLARGSRPAADPCGTGERPGAPPAPLTATERRELARVVRDARVELWSGDEDRILRRMNVALRLAVPEDRRGAAGGLQGGTLRFDLVLGAINEDQDIAAPKDAQPLGALTERFGGGGGLPAIPGLGGAGSGGGSERDDYLRCLRDAGNDVERQQRCAALARG